MHPEFLRSLAEQRRADLARSAARWRPAAWSLTTAAGRWLRAVRPRHPGGGAARIPQPQAAAVFLSGTQGYGLRIWLTPAEAGRLARDLSRMLGTFADRADHPGRRPADAVGMEVVVLSRRLPELTGTGPGLPGRD